MLDDADGGERSGGVANSGGGFRIEGGQVVWERVGDVPAWVAGEIRLEGLGGFLSVACWPLLREMETRTPKPVTRTVISSCVLSSEPMVTMAPLR